MTRPTPPLVIFHGGCTDGACAAAVVLCAHPTAELHPAGYDDGTAPDVRGRHVFIVDFSYPRAILVEMERQAESLLVLDHHRSARDQLAGLPFARFDMDRSGAGMTWDHFFPGEPMPWIVRYVQDTDLWRFEEPFCKEVRGYLKTLPTDPDGIRDVWMATEHWAVAHGDLPGAVVEAGRAVHQFQQRYVERVAEGAQRATIAGVPGPVVNAPYPMVSDLLHSLDHGECFAAAWYETENGDVRYSLRSAPDGVDVSAIAVAFGGGGHKHAAGFTVPRPVHATGFSVVAQLRGWWYRTKIRVRRWLDSAQ